MEWIIYLIFAVQIIILGLKIKKEIERYHRKIVMQTRREIFERRRQNEANEPEGEI